jgi:hypothetical protein
LDVRIKPMSYKRRRLVAVIVLVVISLSLQVYQDYLNNRSAKEVNGTNTTAPNNVDTQLATTALGSLEVKGRAPKTNYKRSNFGEGWQNIGSCDTRNYILARDLTAVVFRSDSDCTVVSGELNDPYTGQLITFIRGAGTSDKVQIDHVVALSDSWQKGAQALSYGQRVLLANDGLNLLAVDGQANQNKGDADAASWLPANKAYRCQYVARQIAVKQKYHLWVTDAEKRAMLNVLSICPDQHLPEVIIK